MKKLLCLMILVIPIFGCESENYNDAPELTRNVEEKQHPLRTLTPKKQLLGESLHIVNSNITEGEEKIK